MEYFIENIKIIDGTGSAPYYGSLGIQNGTIILFPQSKNAECIIDGTGYTVCPGFIDAHSHADLCIGGDPMITSLCKLSQGVTTEITGNCGFSIYPVLPEHLQDTKDVLGGFISERMKKKLPSFSTYENFISYANFSKKATNHIFLVGHSNLRAAVMGCSNRKPTKNELEQMKKLLKDAMEHGARGLSSGLVYIPGTYCDQEELIELCKVISPFSGICTTHMRNEADDVVASVKDSIEIAKAANVSLVISHHKICGRQNTGLSKQTLQLIHDANEENIKVNLDVYPYHATQTTLDNCLPPEYFSDGIDSLIEKIHTPSIREEIITKMKQVPSTYDNPYRNAGGFSGILISRAAKTKDAIGKTIVEYAKERNEDPFDTFFYLLVENHFEIYATYFSLSEDEMLRIYQDPYSVVGSDALIGEIPAPTHPRAFGSFIKPLAEFALKRNIISLEDAISKQTSRTAKIYGLSNKGIIQNGYDADLVIFHESTLKANADFKDGTKLASGIKMVFVNGTLSYQDMKMTGAFGGRCIL